MANLLDIRTWNVGTGHVPGFDILVSSAANNRYIGTDPWGRNGIIWDSVSIASATYNGGFTINPKLNIDITKRYRFSVWQKRTVTGDGAFCFGVWGYNNVGANVYTKNIANDTDEAYFFWNSPSPQNEWFLQVGYVHPYDYGTTPMADSGTWRTNGTKYGNVRMDMKWVSTQVTAITQMFLYTSTDINTRQSYMYPRIEICDGTEPTLTQLLRGHKYMTALRTSSGTFNIKTQRL